MRRLKARGWQLDGGSFEIPTGPCYLFHDPSRNSFALYPNDRPEAMEDAHADPVNAHALRDE